MSPDERPADVRSTPIRHRVNSSLLTGSFLARARSALAAQRSVLHAPAERSRAVFTDILNQAEDTFFGRKHGLANVRTTDDWKKAVPIRRYQDFQPYIDKLLDGDTGVLTANDPYALLRTSGSSGRPKLVPTTRHWRNTYRGPALYAQWGLYFETVGFAQVRGSAVLDLSWERSAVAVNVGGFSSYPISQRPAAVSSVDWLPPWYDEDWFRGVADEEYKSCVYRKLRLLAGADVRVIVALNPSKIVTLAEVLAERGTDLAADVRNGTLEGRPCHAERDRELGARLDARCRGAGPLRLSDLWPRLSLVVAWNSASAALYRPWLDEVTPRIPKLPFSATGTEGIVTMPVDGHASAGPLAVDLGLYEFAPADDQDEDSDLKPDSETLDYRELETGRTYSVVLSQANGLYRYDVGDRYTVVGRVGAVPRLDFAGRSGFGSSFTGEKLTEEDVYQAVCTALGETWQHPPMFSCVPVWATPPGYVLAIERPTERAFAVRRFEDLVENALQQLNSEYAEKRRSGRLKPLSVLPVEPGAFAAAEERRRREGASAAQLKHHWIQRNGDFLGYLGEPAAPGQQETAAGSTLPVAEGS